jgi:predicted nucleic acid-binding Zn ribbon protein
MPESINSFQDNDRKRVISCYNCGFKIDGINQKVCQNCNAILNPNDLEWKTSFISFLCLLCLIPILIAIISILMLSS